MKIADLLGLLMLMFTTSDTAPKNVLFLMADDLRPELGAYLGPDFPSPVHPPIFTPNLDKLASRSLLLKRAYCQQALCSPSRTSMMTGRRPDTTHIYDLHSYWRKVGGNYVTIPQYFKQHGYRSIGIGKIFHPGAASGQDDPESWTEPVFHASNKKLYAGKRASWYSVSAEERKKNPLPDEQIAERAIEWIHKFAEDSKIVRKPFFMAVGLHKPHLPFVFPGEFLNYYPSDEVKLPDNPYAPWKMPEIAWTEYNEVRKYRDVEKYGPTGKINTTLPNHITLKLRRAYYCATSYADAMIGAILKELEKSGLADDTVISFVSDHGFQLGENGEWAKHTNFDKAAHTPMMIRVPGQTDRGIESEALTELVDLYPTLVEAAGLPTIPLCPERGATEVEVCREGQSLMPLIEANAAGPCPDVQWKKRVFYQFPKGGGNYKKMGYSMRTSQYRYTEWVGFTGPPEYKPKWNLVYDLELYDHHTDPEENYNVVNVTSYKPVVSDLHQKLMAGWRAAQREL